MSPILNKTFQIESESMASLIQHIIQSHIIYLAKNNYNKQKIDEIYNCLKLILNEDYQKFEFDENIFDNLLKDGLCENEFQQILSKLNEKESIRKSNGVYYTPKDVVEFMVNNCFNKRGDLNNLIVSNLKKDNNNIHFVIYNDTVFDPTCGTGEFLLVALEKKIELIKDEHDGITDNKLLEIIATIYGNDINQESIEITKIRLFFMVIKYSSNPNYYNYFVEKINNNMTCRDFVNIDINEYKKFDIIIGNPPYVENRNLDIKPNVKYGNIYANILHNSIDVLSENGVMGFIIPISYTSTLRMKKIRSYIYENTKQQIVLNYADRPDCLFTSVHQKLSIVFGVQGYGENKSYASGYKYWYKSERNELFKDVDVIEIDNICEDFYPKLGNSIEKSIFDKVFTSSDDNIILKDLKLNNNVYLNMRACFWIKAFSFNPGSNEYKGFCFNDKIKDFMLCLLNSSLFFLYWNIVSDCWHITTKELKYFRVPNDIVENQGFDLLAKKLEDKLESTKKYIGTKQTEYEYKHKLCKDVIDEIDDKLLDIYKLTEEELLYIKSYSSKYRESLGG